MMDCFLKKLSFFGLACCYKYRYDDEPATTLLFGHIRERHMPVVILMPSIFLEWCFSFLESLDFNKRF
jgi:hypothetical protein